VKKALEAQAVLVHDADPVATRAVVGVLLEEPDLIADADLLVLAERDLPPAVRAAKRLAAAPGFDLRQIRPALFCALRGDASGRKALETAAADERLAQSSPDQWVAACAGLRALGDKATWKSCVERQERALEGVSEEHGLRQAASNVLRLEYYAAAVEGGKPPSVAGRACPPNGFIEARMSEIGSMEEARRRFAALRAL
jgi:hypothetical protein